MINIKSYLKKKENYYNNSNSSSSTNNNSTATSTSLADTFFYYNDDTGFVTCRFPLCSVDNIVAYADGTEAGGGSGGGSNVEVIDNLESTSTVAALSANMGRNLKQLIDDIQTQSGGGGTATSIDWQNIQNKPSNYPPSQHTHSISDVTGLQNNLTTLSSNISTTQSNLQTHIIDSSVHVTQQQHNILSQLTAEQIAFIVRLMQICSIDSNGNITFNGNVNSRQNVTAMV